MSRKVRHILESDSTDYHKGYADGMKAAFEESELDAYYAGVGYGKKSAGDKHIGFNSAEERYQFEKGIKNRGKHFNSVRVEPKSLLEKIIDTFGRSARKKRKVDRKTKKNDKKRFKKRFKQNFKGVNEIGTHGPALLGSGNQKHSNNQKRYRSK